MEIAVKENEKITTSTERLELARKAFEESTGGTFDLFRLGPKAKEGNRANLLALLVEGEDKRTPSLGELRKVLAELTNAVPGKATEVDEQVRSWFVDGPKETSAPANEWEATVGEQEEAKPSMSDDEIQIIVDELVWKHDLPLSPYRLVEAGLKPEQITHAMLAVAKENAKARLAGVVGFQGKTVSIRELSEGDEFTYPPYSNGPDPVAGGKVLAINGGEANVLVRRRSGKTRQEGWTLTTQVIFPVGTVHAPLTNDEENRKMDPSPRTDNQPTKEEDMSNTVKVPELEARQLLVRLGYKMAYDPDKWSGKKVAKAMNDTVRLANPAAGEPDDPDQLALLRRCLKAIQDGHAVEVRFKGAEGKAETNGQAGAKKEPKKAKENGTVKAERDKFGLRTGTIISTVGAAVSKEFRPWKDIFKDAGISNKYRGYLDQLAERGFLKVKNDEYSLKANVS